MAVEIRRDQLDDIANAIQFSDSVAKELANLPAGDRQSHSSRANECFVQAVCWCKLDLALHSGITQENQCLPADALTAELRDAAKERASYIISYILDELDLPPGNSVPSTR